MNNEIEIPLDSNLEKQIEEDTQKAIEATQAVIDDAVDKELKEILAEKQKQEDKNAN